MSPSELSQSNVSINQSLVKVAESPQSALLAPDVVRREAVVAAALDVQRCEVQAEVDAGVLLVEKKTNFQQDTTGFHPEKHKT